MYLITCTSTKVIIFHLDIAKYSYSYLNTIHVWACELLSFAKLGILQVDLTQSGSKVSWKIADSSPALTQIGWKNSSMIFTCNSFKLTWIESYNTYLLGIQSPIAQDVLIYTLWDRSSHGYFHQTLSLSSDGVLGELGVKWTTRNNKRDFLLFYYNCHVFLYSVKFWLNMLWSNRGCLCVCVCLSARMCVCACVCVIFTAKTDRPILMKPFHK